MKTKPRRGRFYLGTKLQTQFLRRLAMYWLLYHVALWQGMFFIEYFKRGDAFLNGAPAVPFSEILRSFAWQNASLVVAALAAGPLLMWDVCRLTHRVAGPLLRLEKMLLRMAHGERVAPLNCREGDLIQGLEKAFNAYLASLDEREAAAAWQAARQAAEQTVAAQHIAESGELSECDFKSLLNDITNTLEPVAPGQISLS